MASSQATAVTSSMRSYSFELAKPDHGNKFAGGAVNGWQLSGVTQIESGANLTYNSGNVNFN